MDDLISRAAAIAWFFRPYSNEESYSNLDVERALKALPTVDAAPVVHGKWQWLSSTYDRTPCEMRYWCSRCKHETITHGSEPWERFCPNCGARMDGDQHLAFADQSGAEYADNPTV